MKLYKQSFMQEQIAKQLGVSQSQIQRDLEEFNLPTMGKSKPAKTASNPKGGRPKGSGKGK